MPPEELARVLEEEMVREAQALNFEKATSLRDRLEEVRIQLAVKKQGYAARKRGRSHDRSR